MRASALGRTTVRLAAAACLAALGACGEEETAAEAPPVRAIKYMTLQAGAAVQQRRIAGVVEAGTTSNAAFQTGGQVVELAKKVGDAVKLGDLLARLDPEPLRLRMESARSELRQAQASAADAESKHRQQKQLFDRGYATRTSYESALATLQTTRGAVGVARSAFDIAQRDLNKAELRAPFAGVIAKRLVEPFEEVSSGQTVYTVQTEGESEVNVSLPETLINNVQVGERVQVLVPLASEAPIPGRIAEIAPLSQGVNAYPVTIVLDSDLASLRPGMSAQAIFEFKTPGAVGAFMIPIAALKPQAGAGGGEVFVFTEGRLDARQVNVINVRDNALMVTGDVRDGEVIATAGVSLLHDGMAARLLDPAAFR